MSRFIHNEFVLRTNRQIFYLATIHLYSHSLDYCNQLIDSLIALKCEIIHLLDEWYSTNKNTTFHFLS